MRTRNKRFHSLRHVDADTFITRDMHRDKMRKKDEDREDIERERKRTKEKRVIDEQIDRSGIKYEKEA